jgi:hypothetical protein
VREVQENELTELLNRALTYDFFNSLDNGFSVQAGTFNRTSDRVFVAVGLDLSSWVDYAVKINNSSFGVIETAVFGGADTTITLTKQSDVLPESLNVVEYSNDSKYIKLLNGTTYTYDSNPVDFNGIRPFLTWKLLAIFVSDGTIKHSDVGNFEIKSMNFQAPKSGDKFAARSGYLQNSAREENNIIDYLNTESKIYELWRSKGQENIQSYNISII